MEARASEDREHLTAECYPEKRSARATFMNLVGGGQLPWSGARVLRPLPCQEGGEGASTVVHPP
jgi:hypothetical protein